MIEYQRECWIICMAARILLAINLGLDAVQDHLPFQVLKMKRIGFRLRIVSKF